MSALVRIDTPMVRGDFLLLALRDVGVSEAQVDGTRLELARASEQDVSPFASCERIVVQPDGLAQWRAVEFVQGPTGYRMHCDSYVDARARRWLGEVRRRYVEHEERAAEAERRRIAEAKRRAQEAQARAIAAKARARGYRVEERRENGRIRLVLRQRVYR